MPRVKAAQAGRQGPAKRRLAEQFAAGEVITDMSKKEWKLGLPIGQGGFGCIYLGKCMTLLPVNCHPKDLCAFKKKNQNSFNYECLSAVPNNLRQLNTVWLGKNASLT